MNPSVEWSLSELVKLVKREIEVNEQIHKDHEKHHAEVMTETKRIHAHIIGRDVENAAKDAVKDTQHDKIDALRYENEKLANSLLVVQNDLVRVQLELAELQKKNFTLANEREEFDKKVRTQRSDDQGTPIK